MHATVVSASPSPIRMPVMLPRRAETAVYAHFLYAAARLEVERAGDSENQIDQEEPYKYEVGIALGCDALEIFGTFYQIVERRGGHHIEVAGAKVAVAGA